MLQVTRKPIVQMSTPLQNALLSAVVLATAQIVSGCDEAITAASDAAWHNDGSSSAPDAGGRDAADSVNEAPPPVGDRRIPYTPATDREFVEFFVEHHRMAIEMAKHELMHGESADVKALAQRVIDAQTPEVESMMTIASSLSDPPAPGQPTDPHSEADMKHMAAIRGPDMDAMFLTDMITHHAAGLPVAHRSQAKLRNAELQRLAADMLAMQAAEISEMQTLREQLNVTGAGEDLLQGSDARADVGLTGDTRIPLTPANDVEFIDFFAPHHAMAIEMAQMVLERGESSEVRAMAQSMLDTQQAEVETLRAARESLTGEPASPMPPADPHMQPEMEAMMTMSGAALDEMFLREMIPHHASGIPTAHRAKPHVQQSELKKMADDIFTAQSQEVGEMQTMLEKFPTN